MNNHFIKGSIEMNMMGLNIAIQVLIWSFVASCKQESSGQLNSLSSAQGTSMCKIDDNDIYKNLHINSKDFTTGHEFDYLRGSSSHFDNEKYSVALNSAILSAVHAALLSKNPKCGGCYNAVVYNPGPGFPFTRPEIKLNGILHQGDINTPITTFGGTGRHVIVFQSGEFKWTGARGIGHWQYWDLEEHKKTQKSEDNTRINFLTLCDENLNKLY
jgi:hypothetical protein